MATDLTTIPIIGPRMSGKTTVGDIMARKLTDQTILPPGRHECSTIFIEIVHRALLFKPATVAELEYYLMLGVKWAARLPGRELHRDGDFPRFLASPGFKKERDDLTQWFARILNFEPNFRFTPENKIENVAPLIWLAKLGRAWAKDNAIFMTWILWDLEYEADVGLTHALVSGTRMPEEVEAMQKVSDHCCVISVVRPGLGEDHDPSNARRGQVKVDTVVHNEGLTLATLEDLIGLHLVPHLLNGELLPEYNVTLLN